MDDKRKGDVNEHWLLLLISDVLSRVASRCVFKLADRNSSFVRPGLAVFDDFVRGILLGRLDRVARSRGKL